MPFKDRLDAGCKLAAVLAKYKDRQPVVLALPRGGVPVAAEVAVALNAPLDLILVRKIGVPFQPELAMGAVVDGRAPIVVRNEGVIRLAGIAEQDFKAICEQELAEIERRRQRYLGSRERVDVAGRTVIVIDDGIATGAVVDGRAPIVVRNEGVIRLAGIAEQDFKAICEQELAEIERRRQRYLGSRERVDVAGRTVIVIDDGIATGATTRAALRATRVRNPKTLVLAVPVAPTENLAAMREEADDVVCLEDYAPFGAIGYYYSDFRQISDQEVTEILARLPARANEARQSAA